MKRSLTQIFLPGLARIMTSFLYGEAREQFPADIPVIQACTHSEPPIAPDPITDEIIMNVIWAQRVEQKILAGMHYPSHSGESIANVASEQWRLLDVEDPDSMGSLDGSLFGEESMCRSTEFGDRIYLVKVTRSGENLTNALHNGRDLEEVRAAAFDMRQSCKLPSGASIFVYPNQYQTIRSAISQFSLRPHHVLVAEAFLPLLLNAVASIPCRRKVKVSNSEPIAWVDDQGFEVAVVERTFLNVRSTCLNNVDDVTRSTSQARYIANPRIHALE